MSLSPEEWVDIEETYRVRKRLDEALIELDAKAAELTRIASRPRPLSKWAYILIGVALAGIMGACGISGANAVTALQRDARSERRKQLQDTINLQTVKLLEEQQDEIDALKSKK